MGEVGGCEGWSAIEVVYLGEVTVRVSKSLLPNISRSREENGKKIICCAHCLVEMLM